MSKYTGACLLAVILLAGCGKTQSSYKTGHDHCSGTFPVDMDGDGRFGKHDAQLEAQQNWSAQRPRPKDRTDWVSGCANAVRAHYAALRLLDPTLPPIKP